MGVVKRALEFAAHDDLPGDHHFYITFATRHPGTEIPDRLHEQYEQEMTIVLQHEFWDLEIGEEQFSVSLNFNSVPSHLVVPYAAIMNFYDPSVKFGLQFTVAVPDEAPEAVVKADNSDDEPTEDQSTGGDVVSLDAFRKK